MTRKQVAGVCCLVIVLFTCVISAVPLDIAINLIVGWVFFLARVLPAIRIGWGGVATAIVCLALLAVGLHGFASWLDSQLRDADEPPMRRWKWRRTGGLIALIVVMFVAGLATVGVTHQAGWLLTSREPLIGGGTRLAVWRSQSAHNLKQIGLGLTGYRARHGAFPPGGTFAEYGRPMHGWQTMILPSIEQVPLYNQVNFDFPWDDHRNSTCFQTVLNSYLNPGIPSEETTAGSSGAPSHYAGNARVLGAHALRTIADGESQTIMAGEVAGGFKPWGFPANWRDPAEGINRSPDGFGSPHPSGANVLFVDGSVRFLKDSIDPRVLKPLSTPAGGEIIAPDRY
jgi:prepilin-type processing-associated H-X9-DG protein